MGIAWAIGMRFVRKYGFRATNGLSWVAMKDAWDGLDYFGEKTP
jgi:hypothetical protein